MIKFLYENNDIVIQITGLKNATTKAYINDAIATIDVYKSDGSLEANGVWPITMTYVPNSRGNYRGVLPYSLDFTVGEEVQVVVIAVGQGITSEFSECVQIRRRN